MNRIRQKKIVILFSILMSILIIIFYFYRNESSRRLILSCNNFNIFIYDKDNSSHLKRNTHLYQYADGTGIRTEQGVIDNDKNRYYVDRDFFYVYRDHEDGVSTVEYTKMVKRLQDNAPDGIWGLEYTPGTNSYISIIEIAPNLFLFRERSNPIAICHSSV